METKNYMIPARSGSGDQVPFTWGSVDPHDTEEQVNKTLNFLRATYERAWLADPPKPHSFHDREETPEIPSESSPGGKKADRERDYED